MGSALSEPLPTSVAQSRHYREEGDQREAECEKCSGVHPARLTSQLAQYGGPAQSALGDASPSAVAAGCSVFWTPNSNLVRLSKRSRTLRRSLRFRARWFLNRKIAAPTIGNSRKSANHHCNPRLLGRCVYPVSYPIVGAVQSSLPAPHRTAATQVSGIRNSDCRTDAGAPDQSLAPWQRRTAAPLANHKSQPAAGSAFISAAGSLVNAGASFSRSIDSMIASSRALYRREDLDQRQAYRHLGRGRSKGAGAHGTLPIPLG